MVTVYEFAGESLVAGVDSLTSLTHSTVTVNASIDAMPFASFFGWHNWNLHALDLGKQ